MLSRAKKLEVMIAAYSLCCKAKFEKMNLEKMNREQTADAALLQGMAEARNH